MEAFEKIKTAKEKIAEQREQASAVGALKPRGLGGPVHTDIKVLFDELGVTEEVETLGNMRKLFEARFRRKGLEIYNTYLVGKKGSPTHHAFSEDMKKRFLYGFDLYTKTFLRLDEAAAPKPFDTYIAKTSGGSGSMKIVDEESKESYYRRYIADGKDVSLPRKDEAHHFNRDDAAEGYATKYQNVLPNDPELGALAAYMFEKFRAYEAEFFDNINTALAEGVDLKRALDFGTYSYGLDASVIEEMSPFGFEPNETAQFAISNRTRVRKVFDNYQAVGPKLEQEYQYKDEQGNRHPWVRGPKMMRHFIFAYPDTIEAGVQVVDAELPQLRVKYPMIPERILVEICISSPENYDTDIQEFLAAYQEVQGSITVPSSWLPAQTTATPAFSFYKTTPEAMVCFFRTKNKRALEEAMQNSELVHARLREKAAIEGQAVSFHVSRQVLRTFLLRNISRTKAIEEAKRFQDREIKNRQELYGIAEKLFPHASEEEIRYCAELGYGDTPEEIVNNGALMVELFSEGKNPSEAELYIEDCIELFYRYIDAGFPQDAESIKGLKDALSMDMVNPKDFYERVLQRPWPAHVPILNAASEDIS